MAGFLAMVTLQEAIRDSQDEEKRNRIGAFSLLTSLAGHGW